MSCGLVYLPIPVTSINNCIIILISGGVSLFFLKMKQSILKSWYQPQTIKNVGKR